MQSFEITNHKEFMGQLLGSEKFDIFMLKEARLVCGNTFTIDGRDNKEFWGGDKDLTALSSPYEYAPYGRLRGTLLELIKGKNTPLSMKITLYLNPKGFEMLKNDTSVTGIQEITSWNNIDYLALNIKYDEKGLNLTSAVAYREFTLDKEIDHIWDKWVSLFLG